MTAEADGVAAAVVAGCLYNLAVVVQKSQAEGVAESGMAILGSLMARPLWLLGVALQVLGLVFHAYALTEAPVTVVQPIIASGIAFLVLFAALILRERPSPRELFGMRSRCRATLLAIRSGPAVPRRRRGRLRVRGGQPRLRLCCWSRRRSGRVGRAARR